MPIHASDHACHACDHHGHGALPSTPNQVRSLKIALVLVSSFSAAEIWVSTHSHSLSLLADAGHMVSDVFAMALALWTAYQLQQGDRDGERLNAIAALVNGTLLLAISGWLGWECWGVWRSPPAEILSGPVAITAAVGLSINGLNAYFLHRHAEDNLNLRGAFLHMLADAGSCAGVLVSAGLMAKFGWYWADGVVSGAIALLIALNAVPLIQQSWIALNSATAASDAASEL